MTKIGLIQFLLLFLVSAAYGQKVKYKDIYALLSTKQFEQAESFLRHYLRENADNANACLFMGNIFQDKASKTDVLKQTQVAIANMDSAILFYGKAEKLLDEREVRKNKKYYQAYNRRDLRTGEFGVKLSDIQFDIGKKIEGLKERVLHVTMAKDYLALADTTYQLSNALFLSLQKRFSSEGQLYLRADEQTLKELKTLAARFDSCLKFFENYRSVSSSLGNTGYNQQVLVEDITDFKKPGVELPDFFQDEVKLRDYKTFADKARVIIEKEIMPMQERLVSHDMEINKLREKLNNDSVSVRDDLMKLVDNLLYDQLKQYDPEPLPMLVFDVKTTDLEYRSALLEHKPWRDSADIHLQISMIRGELQLLDKLDRTAARLDEERLADKAVDYPAFIRDTYGHASALEHYLTGLRDLCFRAQREKSAQLDQHLTALNYIVDGADTIPLSSEIVSVYKPLVTTPEKFTMGLSLRDNSQLQGYFYTITSSRTPEVKVFFPLDQKTFQHDNLPVTKGLACADEGEQIYFVLFYSEKAVKEKFPATLGKIHHSDGLAWKKDLPLVFTPSELIFTADRDELVIRNGLQQTIVDMDGEVVR